MMKVAKFFTAIVCIGIFCAISVVIYRFYLGNQGDKEESQRKGLGYMVFQSDEIPRGFTRVEKSLELEERYIDTKPGEIIERGVLDEVGAIEGYAETYVSSETRSLVTIAVVRVESYQRLEETVTNIKKGRSRGPLAIYKVEPARAILVTTTRNADFTRRERKELSQSLKELRIRVRAQVLWQVSWVTVETGEESVANEKKALGLDQYFFTQDEIPGGYKLFDDKEEMARHDIAKFPHKIDKSYELDDFGASEGYEAIYVQQDWDSDDHDGELWMYAVATNRKVNIMDNTPAARGILAILKDNSQRMVIVGLDAPREKKLTKRQMGEIRYSIDKFAKRMDLEITYLHDSLPSLDGIVQGPQLEQYFFTHDEIPRGFKVLTDITPDEQPAEMAKLGITHNMPWRLDDFALKMLGAQEGYIAVYVDKRGDSTKGIRMYALDFDRKKDIRKECHAIAVLEAADNTMVAIGVMVKPESIPSLKQMKEIRYSVDKFAKRMNLKVTYLYYGLLSLEEIEKRPRQQVPREFYRVTGDIYRFDRGIPIHRGCNYMTKDQEQTGISKNTKTINPIDGLGDISIVLDGSVATYPVENITKMIIEGKATYTVYRTKEHRESDLIGWREWRNVPSRGAYRMNGSLLVLFDKAFLKRFPYPYIACEVKEILGSYYTVGPLTYEPTNLPGIFMAEVKLRGELSLRRLLGGRNVDPMINEMDIVVFDEDDQKIIRTWEEVLKNLNTLSYPHRGISFSVPK